MAPTTAQDKIKCRAKPRALAQLLTTSLLSAEQLLVAERPDARLSMQKEALQVARSYEQEAKERLRRINLMAAGLEVVGSRKLPPEQAPTVSLDEAWYDEGGTPTLTSSDPIEEET